jgi:hypothetical protein
VGQDPDRTQPRQAHKASPASVDYWLERVDPDGTMTPETPQTVIMSNVATSV